jgi:hypothetical protein
MPNRDRAMGRFTPAVRVGSSRRPATGRPEEWPSRGGSPLDRIRLTGPPRISVSGERLRRVPFTSPAPGGAGSDMPPAGVFGQDERNAGLTPRCGRILVADRNRSRGLHPGRRIALQLPAQKQTRRSWLRKPYALLHPGQKLRGSAATRRRGQSPRSAWPGGPRRGPPDARYPRRAEKKSRMRDAEASSPIPP